MTKEEIKTRERLLGIVGTKYPIAGTERFGALSLERFKRLIDNDFLRLRDKEQYVRFIKFMENHPEFTAHGYCVSPDRLDTRVVIEGIETYAVSANGISDFKEYFKDADELETSNGKLFCKFNYKE